MSRKSRRRETLLRLLARGELESVVALARSDRGIKSTLISLSYEKAELGSWRAMDALGRICAGEPASRVRDTITRLLWMVREESGTNPWSAAEIIGEIVARTTDGFEDIVPIVITFAGEPIMRAGAMRAMYRIGQMRPELVQEFAPLALGHSGDADPQVRGYAALALGVIGETGNPDKARALKRLAMDNEPFLFYDGQGLCAITVREAARMAGNGSPGRTC